MKKLEHKYNMGMSHFENRLDIYKIGDTIEEFFSTQLMGGEKPFG